MVALAATGMIVASITGAQNAAAVEVNWTLSLPGATTGMHADATKLGKEPPIVSNCLQNGLDGSNWQYFPMPASSTGHTVVIITPGNPFCLGTDVYEAYGSFDKYYQQRHPGGEIPEPLKQEDVDFYWYSDSKGLACILEGTDAPRDFTAAVSGADCTVQAIDEGGARTGGRRSTGGAKAAHVRFAASAAQVRKQAVYVAVAQHGHNPAGETLVTLRDPVSKRVLGSVTAKVKVGAPRYVKVSLPKKWLKKAFAAGPRPQVSASTRNPNTAGTGHQTNITLSTAQRIPLYGSR